MAFEWSNLCRVIKSICPIVFFFLINTRLNGLRVVDIMPSNRKYLSDRFFLIEQLKFRQLQSSRNCVEESKMNVRQENVSESSIFDGYRGARNSNRTRKKYIFQLSTTRRTHRQLFQVYLGSVSYSSCVDNVEKTIAV